jgi:hypothetical protein
MKQISKMKYTLRLTIIMLSCMNGGVFVSSTAPQDEVNGRSRTKSRKTEAGKE